MVEKSYRTKEKYSKAFRFWGRWTNIRRLKTKEQLGHLKQFFWITTDKSYQNGRLNAHAFRRKSHLETPSVSCLERSQHSHGFAGSTANYQ